MIIYEIVSTILFYLCLPFYFLERVIHKKSKGWLKKFGFCEKMSGKVIMIHGCSVGEINAVGNLVRRIREEFPGYRIVLTTSTITGQKVAKEKYSEIADYITYFPFDTIFEVSRFLKRIKPSMVFIVETEIWPCFASGCKKRNIPLFIINGRISDQSYPYYNLLGFYFKHVLNNYTTIFTQSDEDTKKFLSIGEAKEHLKFMGNLKFDIKKSNVTVDLGQAGYRILIAGSTHKPENKIIIDIFSKLKSNFPMLKLVIAPRHLEHTGDIGNLCTQNNLNYGLRSKNDLFSDKTDVIILDTLGELGKMYSICDIAFIGGSLNKTGGHNPLEATIWKKPVISGSCVTNFKDIYGILTNCGAAKLVNSEEELYNALNNILSDNDLYAGMSKSCETVFEQQKEAANYVVDVIKQYSMS